KRPSRWDGEESGPDRIPTTVRARSRSRRKQVHCHLTHRTPAAPVLFRNGLAQREPPGDWGKSTPSARQTLCQRQTRGVEEFACTLAIRDRAVSVIAGMGDCDVSGCTDQLRGSIDENDDSGPVMSGFDFRAGALAC